MNGYMLAAVMAALVLTPFSAWHSAQAKGAPIPIWRAILHGAFVAAVAAMFFAIGGWWALPGALLCVLPVVGFVQILLKKRP